MEKNKKGKYPSKGMNALAKKRPDVAKKIMGYKEGGKAKTSYRSMTKNERTQAYMKAAMQESGMTPSKAYRKATSISEQKPASKAKEQTRAGMMNGGVANHAQLTGFGKVRPEVKKFGK